MTEVKLQLEKGRIYHDGRFFFIVEAQRSGRDTHGTFQKKDKHNHHILGEEYDSGGAGIITTVSDYEKLLAALANGGLGLTGERILSAYSIELL